MRKLGKIIHHLFVPHEYNNFRARLLHHDILSVFLLFAFIVVFSVRQIQGAGQILGFATDITTQKLFELVNEQRAENNLTKLVYSEALAHAASQKAADMFAKDYWSHYAPDGKTPWNFLYEAGYQYEYAGENLAKNFLFSENVVDAWMASPTHRENILKEEYTEVGFAIANGVLQGEETTLIVQMLGVPRLQAGAIQEVPVQNNPALSGVFAAETSPIDPKSVPFNVFWIVVGLLFIALITDLYFAYKLNLVRFHGKNIPHLVFLLFISIGFALFITKGSLI